MWTNILRVLGVLAVFCVPHFAAQQSHADVRAWEGTIEIPTYRWEEDINPKFWALEGGAKMSTTIRGAITYPYVMQDHVLRENRLAPTRLFSWRTSI